MWSDTMSVSTKRGFLKGVLNGAAIAIGLPMLDLFLDGNGEAMAATGAPIPTRFGTWFWACGCNEKRFFPDQTGTDFQFKDETIALDPHKDKLTIFSGFNAILDGQPNLTHWSGVMDILGGAVPSRGGNGVGTALAPTIDCLVADHIGSDRKSVV